MRLLHTSTYQLETFIGNRIPPYAILSHTWGKDEFVFEDLKVPISDQLDNPKRGLRKVLQACALAIEDGFNYVWIDTCCIDKSSSAELSEAINSMFACEGAAGQYDGFEYSNWFRRGWTLQELIAPHGVTFYDSNWNLIDDRYSLAGRISDFTSIKQGILRRRHERHVYFEDLPRLFSDRAFSSHKGDDNLDYHLWKTPTATRMAWAAGRRTTRAEDEAYCLLGLFDVNMPLLYGEGRNKAFRRLIFEMLQHNQADSSILLWQMSQSDFDTPWLCLPTALRPSHFECGFLGLHLDPWWPKPDLVVTPRGLEVSVWLAPSSAFSAAEVSSWESKKNCQLAVLSPSTGRDRITALGIFVTPISTTNETLYTRAEPSTIVELQEAPGGYVAATIRHRIQSPLSSVSYCSCTGECNQVDVHIHQSKFVMTRIMLSIRQAVPYSVTGAAALSVDARNCGPYSIHIMTPTVENLPDQRTSILYFDELKHYVDAADSAILAFTTADLSSGFFVLWRDGANQQGGTVAVAPWPSLTSGHLTPAESLHILDGFENWLGDKQWSLNQGWDVFSDLPASMGLEGSRGTYSCLPELNVRAMVVRQSFLGNHRSKLLVEVGPAVPETAELWAELWAAKSVEVPRRYPTRHRRGGAKLSKAASFRTVEVDGRRLKTRTRKIVGSR